MLRGIGTVVPIFSENCELSVPVHCKTLLVYFLQGFEKTHPASTPMIFDRDFEFQFNSQTSKIWRAFFTLFALYHGTVEGTLWKFL